MNARIGGRSISTLLAAVVCCLMLLTGRTTGAQNVERPVPFDSAGRLMVLTPRIAERLQLVPPDWPIMGEYDEARLFSTGDSSFVLVVRRGEVFERYPLSFAARSALAVRISAAAQATGMPAQDIASAVDLDNRANSDFVRGQIGLGLVAYGPGIAALFEQPALYFAGVAAGFYVSQAITEDTKLSAPMASMSNDFGFRGWVLSLLLVPGSLWEGSLSAREFGTATLLGSVGGSVLGYNLGRSFTSAEAEAAGWGSTTLALAMNGYFSALGSGGVDYATALGLVAGIPLGVQYPRNVSYVLTSGDLIATRVPQGIAALAGASIAKAARLSDRATTALATTMFLGGVVLGDRLIAKPFDYTPTQAGVLIAGTILTSLAVSSAVGVVNESRETAEVVSATLGAALGALFTHATLNVRAARDRRVSALPTTRAASSRSPKVDFTPTGLLAAAARAPGRHPILSISF